MLLDALKFVQGAVARKDFVPALTHFHIKDGVIKGTDGRISLGSPIALDIDAKPKAVAFVKAIQSCEEEAALHVTPAGRLSIKSGGFKAFIECTTEEHPNPQPAGTLIQLDNDFLPAIKVLEPFIAEDASRPWARGILLKGHSAFATNNVIAIEYWLGYAFPAHLNIPHRAITELLRIRERPIAMQIAENSLTFHYEGGRWLQTSLNSLEWPDLGAILDRENAAQPVPPGLFNALEKLAPFTVDEKVFLLGSRVATTREEGVGASLALPVPSAEACFNLHQLLMLTDVCEAIDFTQYPKPCQFFGNRIRGAIAGMRH